MPLSRPRPASSAPTRAPTAMPAASAVRARAYPRAEAIDWGPERHPSGTANSIAGQYRPMAMPNRSWPCTYPAKLRVITRVLSAARAAAQASNTGTPQLTPLSSSRPLQKRPSVPARAASASPWVTLEALKASWWKTSGVRYSTPPAPMEPINRNSTTWRSAAGNWIHQANPPDLTICASPAFAKPPPTDCLVRQSAGLATGWWVAASTGGRRTGCPVRRQFPPHRPG